MKRFSNSVAALVGVFLMAGLSASVKSNAQLNFSFHVDNTIGDVAGSFSGEIFGLTDNATSSATSVLIESFPAGLNSLVASPVDAVLWDQQVQNSFTVSGGVITGGRFLAQQTIGGFPQGFQLFLNSVPSAFNFLNLDGTADLYVWGDNGLAASNFTRESPASTPEPGSVALFAGLFLCGAVCKRRIRN